MRWLQSFHCHCSLSMCTLQRLHVAGSALCKGCGNVCVLHACPKHACFDLVMLSFDELCPPCNNPTHHHTLLTPHTACTCLPPLPPCHPCRLQDHRGNPVGPQRVWLADSWVPGLAMSRAMGDAVAHSVGVTSGGWLAAWLAGMCGWGAGLQRRQVWVGVLLDRLPSSPS